MIVLEIILATIIAYWIYTEYRIRKEAAEIRRVAAESAHKYLSRFTVATAVADQDVPKLEVPRVTKNSMSVDK